MSSRDRPPTWWQRIFPEITLHTINIDRVGRYNEKNNQWYAEGRRGAIARDEALRRRAIIAKYNTIQRVISGAMLQNRSISWRQARDDFEKAGGLLTDDEKDLRVREYIEKGYTPSDAWGAMMDEVEEAINKLVSP